MSVGMIFHLALHIASTGNSRSSDAGERKAPHS